VLKLGVGPCQATERRNLAGTTSGDGVQDAPILVPLGLGGPVHARDYTGKNPSTFRYGWTSPHKGLLCVCGIINLYAIYS